MMRLEYKVDILVTPGFNFAGFCVGLFIISANCGNSWNHLFAHTCYKYYAFMQKVNKTLLKASTFAGGIMLKWKVAMRYEQSWNSDDFTVLLPKMYYLVSLSLKCPQRVPKHWIGNSWLFFQSRWRRLVIVVQTIYFRWILHIYCWIKSWTFMLRLCDVYFLEKFSFILLIINCLSICTK